MVECVENNWQIIVENWNVFASIVSFLCGGVSGFVFHLIIKKDYSTVKNKNIYAAGDYVGRDKH